MVARICIGILFTIGFNELVSASDEIRHWRDKDGLLNIENVRKPVYPAAETVTCKELRAVQEQIKNDPSIVTFKLENPNHPGSATTVDDICKSQ